MEYSNQQLPEGINTSTEHPLKEFVILTTGVLGVIFLALLLLAILADYLADRIPFSVEQRIASTWFQEAPASTQMQQYLQQLGERISLAMELPEGIRIQVHYNDGDTVNAFATLGGHVVIYRGLLQKLTTENALSTVMAHEIAHISHRDPIRSVGRGVVIGLGVSLVSASVGDAMVESLLGQGASLSALQYSRSQERAADEAARDALLSMYDHVHGARALYEVLLEQHGQQEGVEFFSTHPNTLDRIAALKSLEQQAPQDARLTVLPDGFKKWLQP